MRYDLKDAAQKNMQFTFFLLLCLVPTEWKNENVLWQFNVSLKMRVTIANDGIKEFNIMQ